MLSRKSGITITRRRSDVLGKKENYARETGGNHLNPRKLPQQIKEKRSGGVVSYSTVPCIYYIIITVILKLFYVILTTHYILLVVLYYAHLLLTP
jgi:hypothetical protein